MAPSFLQADPHRCNAADAGSGDKCGSTFPRRRRRCFSCAELPQAAPAPPPSSVDAERVKTGVTATEAATVTAMTTASPLWSLRQAPTGAPAAAARTAGLPSLERSSPSVVSRAPTTAAAAAPAPTPAGRGSLTSRVSAAVTAVILAAAAASAPLGVGAMTESQCEGATLHGTEASLMESPRQDTSTEAAAAGIDRTIVASQETYDRMVSDQLTIFMADGRDLKFKNAWSDHTWLGKAQVTFPGAYVVAEFFEGAHPEFQCMNEYYGLSFARGEAEETSAVGTLSTDRVLNWDLLKPLYEDLEGLDSLVPQDVSSVPPTTFLVAAREEVASEGLTPDFHYFVSEPAVDMDPSVCPEPCSEQVVTYYWSSSAGRVYLLDKADVAVEPRPCWLDLFQAVADGPPSDGIDSSVWNANVLCTEGLLEDVEDAVDNGDASAAFSANSSGGDGDGGGGGGGGGATVVAAAAVLIPAVLVSFAIVAFGLLRHQKGRWLRKMKTTDEAWGEGLDGSGGNVTKPGKAALPGARPPTGKFKLGVSAAAVVAADDDVESGVARMRSFRPPRRVFTDVSIDELDKEVAGVEASGAGVGDVDRYASGVESIAGDGVEDEDMIYPM